MDKCSACKSPILCGGMKRCVATVPIQELRAQPGTLRRLLDEANSNRLVIEGRRPPIRGAWPVVPPPFDPNVRIDPEKVMRAPAYSPLHRFMIVVCAAVLVAITVAFCL